MKQQIVFLFFFFVLPLVLCQDSKLKTGDTSCTWTQDGHTYNFHNLIDYDNNYEATDADEKTHWFFNICKGTNYVDAEDCSCCTNRDTTAYTYYYTKNTCKAWGNWSMGNSYQYIDTDAKDIGVMIINQAASGSKSVRYNMFCNDDEEYVLISQYEYDTLPPHVQINIGTVYACKVEPTPTPSPTPDPYFCQTIQSNELYNLAPAKKLYQKTFNGNKYWLHPCDYVVHTSGCDCCTAGVATGWLQRSDGSCQQLGHLDTSTWVPLPEDQADEGVSLEYFVKTSLGHKTRSMKYDFICDPATEGDIDEINELNLIPPRTEITLTTKYACPQDPLNPTIYPSPTVKSSPTSSPTTIGGVKGGYVFLIVFFCGIASFAIGFFVQKYRKGKNDLYENI
ncbi:hypothetical protein M0813_04240 [Anaeramoeba flamelloides]|uniref:Uncharacterized protein n=1 Tax=Anaeramoeba flamelloides TaxID=1746091 RepID=A0ABQ8XJY6_9EUKA|nr:hypothetical protein M0813_04240 [Anaeramoeba flamelloides]